MTFDILPSKNFSSTIKSTVICAAMATSPLTGNIL